MRQSQGGGGGGMGSPLIFSSDVGSGLAFTVHPQPPPPPPPKKQKKQQEFQEPPKIFEILAIPQNTPILYLDLKKRTKNA